MALFGSVSSKEIDISRSRLRKISRSDTPGAGYGGEQYLFLQDECYPVRDGWISPFISMASAPDVGMVGESINHKWLRPWDELRRYWASHEMPDHVLDGVPAKRVDVYLEFMRRHAIPAGQDGGHLRSLIWFLSRGVLQRMGGFQLAGTMANALHLRSWFPNTSRRSA